MPYSEYEKIEELLSRPEWDNSENDKEAIRTWLRHELPEYLREAFNAGYEESR